MPPPVSSNSAAVETSENWYFVGRSAELLKELQRTAGRLTLDAEKLNTFAQSPQFNWSTHAWYLDSVRGHINKAGTLLDELQGMRDGVTPWQRQAIDRITPVAAEAAAHTEAAIRFLNANQGRHFVPEYRDSLTMIADRATEMKQRVDNYVNYADTKQKHERAEKSLEVQND